MTESTAQRRFIGCCLAFVSAVTFAIQGMFFKLVRNVFYSQVIVIRLLPTLVIVVPIFVYRKEGLFKSPGQFMWLTLSGLSLGIDLGVRYFAIELLPFADVYALALSGVMVLTLLLGRLFLKESCALFEVVICLVILIGMVLVAHPKVIYTAIIEGGDSNDNALLKKRLLGTGFTLLSCAACVCIALFTRKVAEVHFSVIVIHGSFWSAVISGTITTVFGNWSLPQDGAEWCYVCGFALVGTLSILTLFAALTYEEAGAISTIRTSEIPFSYLLQVVFMGVYPSVYSALGASIISLGALTHGLRAWRRKSLENREELVPLNEKTDLFR